MKPSPRRLRLDIEKLEVAFESLAGSRPMLDGESDLSFLDLTTGEIVTTENEDETEALFADGNHLVLPEDLFEGLFYGALDEFLDSLPKDLQRAELARVAHGKGYFRRFKEVVFDSGDVGLKHRWMWFEIRRKRECIVEWLRDENIEPEWGRDIFEAATAAR